MNTRRIIFVSCIIILTALFAEGMWALSTQGTGIREHERQLAPKPAPQSTPKFVSEPGKENQEEARFQSNSYEPVNILILGLDEYEERSDAIILLNIEPNSGKVNILSIARDTRVRARGRYVKINALVGMGGEKLSVNKLEELTGLDIQYYITLNFKGFRKLIDTLGGVEMDIPFNMDYDDPEQNLHIHLKKGKQVLDGDMAEQFVRYRKGNTWGTGYAFGDLDRIKAQQELMKALIEQKVKLRYLSKVDDIFNILNEHMRTNIEIGDVNYYLAGIRNIKYDQIKTFTLPGDSKYTNKVWYYIYDRKKTRKIVEESFFK